MQVIAKELREHQGLMEVMEQMGHLVHKGQLVQLEHQVKREQLD